MKTNIVGYSLKHYAIVTVESKSKKGTKKALTAAMDAVQQKNPTRIITGSYFVGPGPEGEIWVIEYVRPASSDSGN